MSIFWFISTREQKKQVLSDIIKKLNISDEEKELYILSIGVLDDSDFQNFYDKILEQIEKQPSSIIPFSTQLI